MEPLKKYDNVGADVLEFLYRETDFGERESNISDAVCIVCCFDTGLFSVSDGVSVALYESVACHLTNLPVAHRL